MKIRAYQKLPPEIVSKDKYGNEITIGSMVAINRSGKVIIGRILKILKNEWKISRSGCDGNEHWRLVYAAMAVNDDYTTIVRNPNGMVVI